MANFHVDSSGNLWLGDTSTTFTTSAPFYVQSDGTVKATSGTIGGISINSSNIQANYSSGTSGFKIDTNGDAEFNEVKIRVKGNSSDPSPSGVSDDFVAIGDSFIYDFSGSLTLQGNVIRIKDGNGGSETSPSLTFSVGFDDPGFYTVQDNSNTQAKLYWSSGSNNIIHSESDYDTLYIDAANIAIGTDTGTANEFIGKNSSGQLGWHTVSSASHTHTESDISNIGAHNHSIGEISGHGSHLSLGASGGINGSSGNAARFDHSHSGVGSHSHTANDVTGTISVTSVSSGGFVNSLSYNNSNKTLTVGGSNTRLASITTRGYGVQSSGQNVGNGGIGVTLFYTSLNSVSDETLKTGITDLTYGLDWINDLRPISYRYDTRTVYVCETEDCEFNGTEYLLSTDECDGCGNAPVSTEVSWGNTKENWGFSAQEIEATLPTDPDLEIVEDTEFVDGSTKKVLDYNQVIAPLVKAVQELSTQVSDLTARIETLEG